MRLSLGHFLALRGVQIIALLCAGMVDVVTVNATTIAVTATADSGAGSLRDAIAAASDGDTIQFDAALNGQSIMLTSAELAIAPTSVWWKFTTALDNPRSQVRNPLTTLSTIKKFPSAGQSRSALGAWSFTDLAITT